MSTQVHGQASTGQTVYLRRHRNNPTTGAWQVLTVGGSWGTYSAGLVANYANSATEEGSTGIYVTTLTDDLEDLQLETHHFCVQAGGSPADTDTVIDRYQAIYNQDTNQFGPTYSAGSLRSALDLLRVDVHRVFGVNAYSPQDMGPVSTGRTLLDFNDATQTASMTASVLDWECEDPPNYEVFYPPLAIDLNQPFGIDITIYPGDGEIGVGFFVPVTDINDANSEIIDYAWPNESYGITARVKFWAGVIAKQNSVLQGFKWVALVEYPEAGWDDSGAIYKEDLTSTEITAERKLRYKNDPVKGEILVYELDGDVETLIYEINGNEWYLPAKLLNQEIRFGIAYYSGTSFVTKDSIASGGPGINGVMTIPTTDDIDSSQTGQDAAAAKAAAEAVADGSAEVNAKVTDVEAGVQIPMDISQVVVPKSRTFVLTRTSDGLVGEKTLGLSIGEQKTFAIDFSSDLKTGGRLQTLDSIAISTGTPGGVTFGASLKTDRAQGKVDMTGVIAGEYVLTALATYDAAEGGGTAEAKVKLTVG